MCENDKTLLPSEILISSPSFIDGLNEEVELVHRVWGSELIQEAGILLQFPQVVMVTAQNVFHRFFYRKSLVKYDAFSVAMASLLLSAKVEEKPRVLREYIFIFHSIYQKRKKIKSSPLDVGASQYSNWKNNLIRMESFILKELGFCFYNIMDHPHKYILYYIKILDGDANLAQTSWNYLNDAMRLDLSLRYPAQLIACGAIYMSARKIGFPLSSQPPWWSLMTDDFDQIESICEKILQLYNMPKIEWLDPITSVDYLSES